MAQIPTYGGQAVHENVNLGAPMQQLNAPAAAFGSDGKGLIQAGEGLQKGASVLAAVTSEMNKEKDQADALNKTVEFSKQHDVAVADMRAKQGADAVGLVSSYDDTVPKLRDTVGADLSPNARKLYDNHVTKIYVDNRRMFANQEAEQRRDYLYTSGVKLADMKGQTAITNYTDNESFGANVADGVQALSDALKVKGISPESAQGQDAIGKYQSSLVAQRADRFIVNRDFTSAREVLADGQQRGILIGPDAEKIEGKLKEVDLSIKANDLAASWRGMSRVAVFDASRKMADPVLGQRAYSAWMANDAADKNARALYVQDSIVKATDKIDQLSNDPIRLQSYLDSLPRGNADQLRIYQHAQALGRNIITAQTGQTGKFTKAGDYMGLLNDVGPGGKITSVAQLQADPRAANVDAQDRKRLAAELAGGQKVDEHELMRQYKLAAGYANGDDPQAKLTPDDQADFMRFSEYTRGMTQDTKQGKDHDYLKKMALRWKLQGETREWYSPGRGSDRTFGDVLKMPVEKRNEWAPDLPAEGSTDRQLLDAKFSQPGVVDSLKKAYKTTDGEEAKRLYYRDLLFKTVPMMPSKRIGKGS